MLSIHVLELHYRKSNIQKIKWSGIGEHCFSYTSNRSLIVFHVLEIDILLVLSIKKQRKGN